MKSMDELRELLEDEIKKIARKGDISPTELDAVYKAVDVIKDITTIKAMDEAEKEKSEYSRRGYSGVDYSNEMPMHMMGGPVWNRPMRSYNDMSNDISHRYANEGGVSNEYANADASNAGRRGRDGDGDGQYSEEGSYRRGRDRMGRFTSRDGGSYEASNRDSYDASNRGAYRGYSRHTAKERMMGKLEAMLQDAQTEKERMAIRQCLEELED